MHFLFAKWVTLLAANSALTKFDESIIVHPSLTKLISILLCLCFVCWSQLLFNPQHAVLEPCILQQNKMEGSLPFFP